MGHPDECRTVTCSPRPVWARSGAFGSLERVVRVAFGTVVSGDAFVASSRVRRELGRRWGALAVEMEGSAACGVAVRFRLPWIVVRALSDRAGEGSAVEFETFVAAVSDTAA
jgi:adenosylhomocysteine nucleosidase